MDMKTLYELLVLLYYSFLKIITGAKDIMCLTNLTLVNHPVLDKHIIAIVAKIEVPNSGFKVTLFKPYAMGSLNCNTLLF